MIEIIAGAWAAGETKSFMINGEYLEILEAQYPCDVMLMDKAGAQLSIMKSSEASFFSRPREGFQTVQIYSAQAQTIRVFIGSGDAGTRRISSTVQIVDGNKARVMAGGAYAWRTVAGASAGNVSMVQLWNPPGSGKRVIVDSLHVSSSVPSSVYFGIDGNALSANSSIVPYNMASGGASSASTLAKFQYVPALQALNWFGSLSFSAGGNNPVPLVRPFILNPGSGLVLSTDSVNDTLGGFAQFFEETI